MKVAKIEVFYEGGNNAQSIECKDIIDLLSKLWRIYKNLKAQYMRTVVVKYKNVVLRRIRRRYRQNGMSRYETKHIIEIGGKPIAEIRGIKNAIIFFLGEIIKQMEGKENENRKREIRFH